MATKVTLPGPRRKGPVSVEEALMLRRSHREYLRRPLTLAELGQVLWAAYGVTSPEGYRTAPSARALFPLRLYVLAGDVAGLAPGFYCYQASDHALALLRPGDWRQQVYDLTFDQGCVKNAPAVLLVSAEEAKSREGFGDDWLRFAAMDVGHLGQNVHLQAEALGLGTVVICAFRPPELAALLELPAGEVPLYLMPVGAKAERS